MRYFITLCLILTGFPLFADDKVVLQLKWEHEFQFAGYYAALWQGYYAEEALDVEIRPATTPAGEFLSPVDAIASGEAQFSVGDMDILRAKDQGHDMVILAPVFQQSAVSIFSLPHTPLKNVRDLATLRIAAVENDTRTQVLALFRAQGIDPGSVTFIDVPPTVASLEAGLVDAIAVYGVSAKFEAAEKNLELTELSPSDFGIDFYGDTLYTSRDMINEHPEKVKRFVKASLKGWKYALENRQKIADRISSELPRHIITYDNFKLYNRDFSYKINDYLAYPLEELGHNDTARWYRMIQQLKSLGSIEGNWDEATLFQKRQVEVQSAILIPLFFVGLGIVLLLFVYFMRHNRWIFAPYLVVLSGIIGGELLLETNVKTTQENNLRLDVTRQLNSISAKLSGSISNNLSIINGLAAHIATNPDITQQQFELYAKTVFQREPLLINLAAAPDLVVKMIYPLEPNKNVLGLDYRENEAQNAAVLSLKKSGGACIAGPVNLVQGGVAFIGRTAVFTSNETGDSTFWGIVSAPISDQDLYQSAGLLDPSLPLDIAIRGNDGLGSAGSVFFGEHAIFDDETAVKTNISVGSGVWQIAARPKPGALALSNEVLVLRSSMLVATVSLLLLGLVRHRQATRDMRYQEQIHQSEHLLQEVGKLALIGGWKISPDARKCLLSPQSAVTLGLPVKDTLTSLKKVLFAFRHSDAAKLQQHINRAILKGEPFDLELPMVNAEKVEKWLRVIGNPNKLAEDGFEIVGAIQDITERKQFTQVIEQQATYDSLTGLPNRFLFENRLEEAITGAQRRRSKLAVLFVDLDNFKPVNDHLGHNAGDELLKQVGERISACIRESDTLARYSGDEFTIILHDLENDSAPSNIAAKILKTTNLPFNIMDNRIFCSASIGISIYPDDGMSAEALVSNADHAMYEVKKNGRNDWHYFTESMQEKSEQKHVLRTKLAAAISNSQLKVHYQPIIELKSNTISKCEALVRWTDETGTLIPAEEFIAVAEESGMINEIDRLVLKNASHFLINQNKASAQTVGLSVNVSPRLFLAKDESMKLWLNEVTQAAKQLDVTVEITERLLTEDSDRALDVLAELKSANVTIAIDDFGTGYSSLSYLTRFPIDIIKIDQSFIKTIGEDHRTEILTDAIISLARQLSLQVIAEGVETSDQLDFLLERDCDFAQGYLLGSPQSESSIESLLASNLIPDIASG